MNQLDEIKHNHHKNRKHNYPKNRKPRCPNKKPKFNVKFLINDSWNDMGDFPSYKDVSEMLLIHGIEISPIRVQKIALGRLGKKGQFDHLSITRLPKL